MCGERSTRDTDAAHTLSPADDAAVRGFPLAGERRRPSSWTARAAIGASAAADITAQAIPSPVNGSTYPAASPTTNTPIPRDARAAGA